MVKQVGDGLELKNGVAQKGIIIRHLVLPGRIENSKEVLRLIKKENIYVGSTKPHVSIHANCQSAQSSDFRTQNHQK